jgi:diaminopimelate decarboxylase
VDPERSTTLGEIVRRYGTPAFVYFLADIDHRISDLREAFGGRFKISYAAKANPNSHLLALMRDRVDLIDVSSGGEVDLARQAGWSGDRISFTGPGKRDVELTLALDHRVGDIVVESVEEARRLNTLAGRLGRTAAILLRLAPARLPRGFGVNMAGRPTQFGVDEEVAPAAIRQIRAFDHLDLRGFHIYSGTQCLNARSIVENYSIFAELFRSVAEDHGLAVRKLIFGSGLGIPYHEGDEPLDLAEVGRGVASVCALLDSSPLLREAELILETGRYVVGEAGVFLTRVISVKDSRGTRIAVCDGGMNHHLGACGHLGSVIHRNYRIVRIGGDAAHDQTFAYNLVGPLCTSIDTLGHDVRLPELAPGDILGVHCSGAYGLTASPVHFISHPPAKEIIVETRESGHDYTEVSELVSRIRPNLGMQ